MSFELLMIYGQQTINNVLMVMIFKPISWNSNVFVLNWFI